MSGESNLDELRRYLNDPRKNVLIEAKDAYGVWYPAKVIAFKDDKVRVHFCNWSSRYDTWYSLAADCVRIRKPSPNPAPTPKTPPVNNNSTRVLPARPSPVSSDKTFEPGSYVMALWRNQYEYLAEVLSFRCRQNEKAEYRIRFVWDNVIEWTAASRIRQATQAEIDYVLKFCREHGGPGSGKPLTAGADLSAADLKGRSVTCTVDRLASSRTQSSRRESVSKRASAASALVVPTDPVPTEQKNASSVHGFDGVEQDGMLYDKAVIQFHEACRKRRELKRQAIENGHLAQSVPHSTPPNSSLASANLSGAQSQQVARKNVSNPDAKPTKSARVTEQNGVPKPLLSPSDVSVPNSTGPKSSPNQTARSPTPKLFKTPADSPKTDPSPTGTHDAGKLVPKPGLPHVSSSAPTTYPCPHCPRILRHSKLLAAHLANYHKDCCAQPGKRKSSGRSPHHSAISVKTEPPVDSESPADRHLDVGSLAKPQAILLACHPCNTRGILPQPEPGLIQCDGCLCWVHQACHPVPADTSAGRSFFYCASCLLTRRSSRASHSVVDMQHMSYTGQLPWWSSGAEQRNPHHLVSDVADVLNWSHKLQSLVHSGWTVLHQTRLPELSPKKRGLVPCGERLPGDDVAASQHEPTLEKANNEEQVKRLYMEFRASIVQGSQSARQSAHSSFPDTDDPRMTSFPNSLPDSAPCWSIAEDDEDAEADPAIDANLLDSHVLNGFLQDLGPNVISELDLGDTAEPGTSEGSVIPEEADVLTDVLDRTGGPSVSRTQFQGFGDDVATHAGHGPLLSDSAPETPTKGLGPLLTSAHGMNALFQATLTNTFSAGVDSRTTGICGLAPTSMPVSNRTEPTVGVTSTVSPCLTSTPDTKRLSTTLTTTVDARSSSLSVVPDLFEPQLSNSTPNHMMAPPPGSSSPSIQPSSRGGTAPDSSDRALSCPLNPSSPIAVPTSAAPTDVDWLPLDKTMPKVPAPTTNTYDLPFHPALQLSKVDPIATSSTASIIYDTSFNLDTIMTDGLTPDTLCEAQSNLDYLDEYILAPLERALFVMESQLDTVTEQLALLEHPSDKTTDHGRSRTAADCNHSLFSDGSSPFGSSSSFSLSPAAGPVSGESPVFADPTVLARSAQDTPNSVGRADASQSSVKRTTARRLYEYTLSQRSGVSVPSRRP